jgi:hypothetical protein
MFLKRLQGAIIRRGEKVVVNFGKAPPLFNDVAFKIFNVFLKLSIEG